MSIRLLICLCVGVVAERSIDDPVSVYPFTQSDSDAESIVFPGFALNGPIVGMDYSGFFRDTVLYPKEGTSIGVYESLVPAISGNADGVCGSNPSTCVNGIRAVQDNCTCTCFGGWGGEDCNTQIPLPAANTFPSTRQRPMSEMAYGCPMGLMRIGTKCIPACYGPIGSDGSVHAQGCLEVSWSDTTLNAMVDTVCDFSADISVCRCPGSDVDVDRMGFALHRLVLGPAAEASSVCTEQYVPYFPPSAPCSGDHCCATYDSMPLSCESRQCTYTDGACVYTGSSVSETITSSGIVDIEVPISPGTDSAALHLKKLDWMKTHGNSYSPSWLRLGSPLEWRRMSIVQLDQNAGTFRAHSLFSSYVTSVLTTLGTGMTILTVVDANAGVHCVSSNTVPGNPILKEIDMGISSIENASATLCLSIQLPSIMGPVTSLARIGRGGTWTAVQNDIYVVPQHWKLPSSGQSTTGMSCSKMSQVQNIVVECTSTQPRTLDESSRCIGKYLALDLFDVVCTRLLWSKLPFDVTGLESFI